MVHHRRTQHHSGKKLNQERIQNYINSYHSAIQAWLNVSLFHHPSKRGNNIPQQATTHLKIANHGIRSQLPGIKHLLTEYHGVIFLTNV